LNPSEIFDPYSGTATEGRTVLFPASRAMAIQYTQQRTRDLEFDTAAQTTSVNRHVDLPINLSECSAIYSGMGSRPVNVDGIAGWCTGYGRSPFIGLVAAL
jgi:hypothetical protein